MDILFLILFTVSFTIWFIGKFLDEDSISKRNISIFGFSSIVFFILTIVFFSWVVVPAGYTGAIYNLISGTSQTRELSEGSHFVMPFITNVTLYQTRINEYTMSSAQGEGNKSGDDSLWTPTKEGLQVGLDMTIWFYPDPHYIGWIHKNIGPDYAEKIVRPAVKSITRTVVKNYSAPEVYSLKRDQIQNEIRIALMKELAPKHFIVDQTLLREVSYTKEYATSISQKLVAQQDAQKMDFILQKEQKEAERKVIAAKGDAQSIAIVKNEIARQGGSEYIQYLWAQKLPANVQTMIVPGSSNIMVNTPSKH